MTAIAHQAGAVHFALSRLFRPASSPGLAPAVEEQRDKAGHDPTEADDIGHEIKGRDAVDRDEG